MSKLLVTPGSFVFEGMLEMEAAPAFRGAAFSRALER